MDFAPDYSPYCDTQAALRRPETVKHGMAAVSDGYLQEAPFPVQQRHLRYDAGEHAAVHEELWQHGPGSYSESPCRADRADWI